MCVLLLFRLGYLGINRDGGLGGGAKASGSKAAKTLLEFRV